MIFKNQTHQDIWIEHHCGRCHFGVRVRTGHGLQCPILARALKSGRKPVEWERNPRRNALMAETIKCHNETRKPPPVARFHYDGDATIDVPMFDVTAGAAEQDSNHA